MNIVTQTSLKVAPLTGRLNFPKHSLTWIVKGTFDLRPSAPAILSEKQTVPTAWEFYPDDEEKTGSPRYESDFAWHKPRADLLLVGGCYPPGGRSTQSCPVTFRVGDKSKTLAVFGNRRWEKKLLGWKLSEPEPFTRIELRYENSFGGAKSPPNPVGKGFGEDEDDAGAKVYPLPNVESPQDLIQSRRSRPAPAGFGPLSQIWSSRRAKLGTYKGAYVKTRWPWLPEDFDWTHFNAAPDDLQIEGFLRGDERLAFENLHPKHPRYESQLPGIRARCFLNRSSGGRPGELRFEEVELKLDTLWVDMEAEKLVLVWRGWTPVASEDYEEEIQDVFLTSESLSNLPVPAARCHRDFLALKAALAEPFEPEAPPEIEPSDDAESADPAAAAALEAALKKEKEETKKKLEAQAAALNAQFGLDKLPAQAQEQAKQQQAKIIDQLAETDSGKSARLGHAEHQAELKAAFAGIGVDLDNPPPLSDKARAEQARLFKELDLDHPDAAAETAGLSAMLSAALGKAGANLENLDTIINEVKKRKAELGPIENKTPRPERPMPILPPSRESVQAGLADHDSFEGADLHGLDLSGLDLHEADFAGANLSGARLQKTNLQLANLTGANLTGADLSEADLTNANAAGANFSGAKLTQAIFKEADLAGTDFSKADLSKAVLDGAVFEAARFTGACLAECSAVQTLFAQAELRGVNFQRAACPKADFSRAVLEQADFRNTNLSEASLLGAFGPQMNLTAAVLTKVRAGGGSDFSGAKLIEAEGKGSMWKDANLTGADFRHAKLDEALFTSAILKQSNFSAAHLKSARFNKANLTGAVIVRANLFQGNFEKANLTQADLSGSNLYEAEFLDAILDRTRSEGAFLVMTKLEPK